MTLNQDGRFFLFKTVVFFVFNSRRSFFSRYSTTLAYDYNSSRCYYIKDLVQALIETDAGHTEDDEEDEDSEDEDSEDEDSEDEDSEDEDSQDGGSEDEYSHREDNDEAADNTTALGFMKLLGVDIDTPEGGLDTLVDSKYAEGSKGVGILAAAATSSTLPATSFVVGFATGVNSFLASMSAATLEITASFDAWNTAFKLILEQAKLERKLQAIAKAKHVKAAKKASTALLRKAKMGRCNSDLSLDWSGMVPRYKTVVNAAATPVEGHELPNRNSCELLAGELFEKTGSLMTITRKDAEAITLGCRAEACGGKLSFRVKVDDSGT